SDSDALPLADAPCLARLSSPADATAPAYWYTQDTHTSRARGSPWAPLWRVTDVNAFLLSSFLSLPPILPQFYQLVNGHQETQRLTAEPAVCYLLLITDFMRYSYLSPSIRCL